MGENGWGEVFFFVLFCVFPEVGWNIRDDISSGDKELRIVDYLDQFCDVETAADFWVSEEPEHLVKPPRQTEELRTSPKSEEWEA